jgi:hypothetical protein
MGAVESQDIGSRDRLGLHLTECRQDDALEQTLGPNARARLLEGGTPKVRLRFRPAEVR